MFKMPLNVKNLNKYRKCPKKFRYLYNSVYLKLICIFEIIALSISEKMQMY